jgi:AcrR family transcriptional regulator
MKVDRRKQRTRTLLRDALIALILEKGYDSVTVQDITDRANLGRATFYLHYDSKDELLVSMMHDMLVNMMEEAAPFSPDGRLTDGQPTSLLAFQHAEANADLYRAIMGGGGLAGVFARYRKSSTDELQNQLENVLPPDKVSIPIEIIANFVVGAMNALVIWWLEQERPYPADEMARIFQQLLTEGIQSVLTEGEATNHRKPESQP